MVWFRIDDSFYDHPKVKRIPRVERKGAVSLWALEGSYVGKALTEGLVMAEDVADRGATRKDADALVASGLWHPPGYECTSEHCAPAVPDGHYQYHDWLQWNPSKEQVLAERSAAAERQRRAREKAKSRRDSNGSHAVTNSVSHGEVTPLVTVPPTRPDPTPSSTSVDREGGGSSVPRENPPPDSPFCPNHPAGTSSACADCRAARLAIEARRDLELEQRRFERDEADRIRRDCRVCRGDGWRNDNPEVRCDHQPERTTA